MQMISRTIAISIALTALTLAGCGGSGSGKAPDTQTTSGQDRELLEAVKQPLDRAHEVEDITAGRKGELDKQIESAN